MSTYPSPDHPAPPSADLAGYRPKNSADLDAVADAAIRRARGWLAATRDDDSRGAGRESKATEQLAALVQDPEGVRFTMDFVDRVMRPRDNAVAAKNLRTIAHTPSFLGAADASLLRLGRRLGTALPWVVMPAARAYLRRMVGHLILDAESDSLASLLDEAAARGVQLNLNLLGEAVLGDEEARTRTEATIGLVRNPRVTYVSIKASSLCAQLNHWDFAGCLDRLKDKLRPLYRAARESSPRTFVNLDMEEYHDLELTLSLFTALLSEEEFLDLEAGIVVQAYLPDSLAALARLADFARARRDAGGAPIKIRLVKGANLSMERVTADIHGWPQAPYPTKEETDANYLRMLDYVLQPELADAVRIGVASHNLFTLAAAWELAARRGVTGQLDAEMLQGMAPAQARAVLKVFGRMILYTPVVYAEDFDVAISYLIRRLEENSEKQNFLHALFAPTPPGAPDAMAEQEKRFADAIAGRWRAPLGPRRHQDRNLEADTVNAQEGAASGEGTAGEETPGDRAGAPRTGRFLNEPDTDPALAANRRWARDALASPPGPVETPLITDPEEIEPRVSRARALGHEWAKRDATDRALVLERVAESLVAARGALVSAMAHEAGKTITQSDPEVSEAIDFARYYASRARVLARPHAVFRPRPVTVVVPPWNFPVAIPTGGITAALAAGSAVLVKPAPQVVRCAEIVVEAIRSGLGRAGCDPDLVQLVRADEGPAGRALIAHGDVDQVILTGASDTARLFRSWDPRMRISAETSGKNALIITASADPDLAVADLYQSAFGHAGQKCSAASLAILVGDGATTDRIRDQLVDATRTLEVGPGTRLSTTMNGLIEPPREKLLRGLTRLDAGETWLVRPERLNAEGTLWSPGIRDGVRPGSWFHTHECFGPVLGIMYASSLDEAIDWQNSTGFGLTGGIHSLDDDEIAHWIDRVEVGNAYVNRGITGAIVERQPFGGWKDSAVGPGAKAGGPNYVAQLGEWVDGPLTPLDIDVSLPVQRVLRRLGGAASPLGAEEVEWLWRAAELDALACATEFHRAHDPAALASEANIFRYRPLPGPLRIWLGDGFRPRDVARLLLAGAVTGVGLDIAGPGSRVASLAALGATGRAVTDAGYAAEVRGTRCQRIRVLGAAPEALYEAAVESQSVLLDAPVVADGRQELLAFYREQSVSVTMHRFGIATTTGRLRR